MTDDSVPDEGLQWRLAEQIPTGVANEHHIALHREVEGEELARLQEAQQLITHLSASAAYSRCLKVLEALQARLEALKEAPDAANELQGLRAAIGSLRVALVRAASELRESAQTHAADPGSVEDLAQACDAAPSHPSWADLEPLSDPAKGAFLRHKAGAIAWRSADGQQTIDVRLLATTAVLIAQELQINQFLALKQEIERAAVTLRTVGLEVLGGTPLLVSHPKGQAPGGPGSVSITPVTLALDKIPVVINALRLAETFSQEAAADVAAGGTEDVASSDQDREQRLGEAGRGYALASEPGEEAAAQPEEVGSPEPGPDVGGGDTERRAPREDPADLGELFRLSRVLDDDLAQEWSRALDEAALTPALASQLAAFFAASSALARMLVVESAALEAAGIDPRLAGWPLRIEAVSNLLLRPDDATTTELYSRLAQLSAFEAAIEATRALQEPSTTTVSFGLTESVERFWTAGGFRLIADRVDLLQRLTQLRIEAVTAVTGKRPATSWSAIPWDSPFQRLQLAGRALSAGDPEAALVHTAQALLKSVAGGDGAPEDLVAKAALERSDFPNGSDKVLARALEAARSLTTSAPDDLATVALLAEPALSLASALQMPPRDGPRGSIEELAAQIEANADPFVPLETVEEPGQPSPGADEAG